MADQPEFLDGSISRTGSTANLKGMPVRVGCLDAPAVCSWRLGSSAAVRSKIYLTIISPFSHIFTFSHLQILVSVDNEEKVATVSKELIF